MPRLEDVLADLARVPHARAAALAGFDGLLVDEAFPPDAVADVADGPPVRGADVADGPPVRGADVADVADGPPVRGADVADGPPALDGAIVELTHAWNAVRRASTEYLGAGEARELVIHADRGLLCTHVVAGHWFALLWAAPEADPGAARDAVRVAAGRLAEVVG